VCTIVALDMCVLSGYDALSSFYSHLCFFFFNFIEVSCGIVWSALSCSNLLYVHLFSVLRLILFLSVRAVLCFVFPISYTSRIRGACFDVLSVL